MADPVPIPPSTALIDQEQLVNMAGAAAAEALTVVVRPLSVGLDGLSVSFGSAAEAVMTADRFLDLIDKQRKLAVQAKPFSISQVVRG